MAKNELRNGAVTVAGLRSPLIESGPSDASEAVFFVHGNPGSAGDWRRLVSETGAFARAAAFDLPGFGQADKPDHFDYTVRGYVAHLERVLETSGISRVHLVLHDFGGAFGLGYAAAHPERVASLVLLNIGILPGYRWHWAAQVWRTPLIGELFMATTSRPGFRMILKQGNPRGLPGEFVDEMWRNFDWRTRRAVLRLYRATDPSIIHDLGERTIATFRTRELPVLVIWGQADPYLPWQYAERQREAFPGAEIHLLEDSGHWPYADNPEAVSRLALPFLQRATGSSRPAIGAVS